MFSSRLKKLLDSGALFYPDLSLVCLLPILSPIIYAVSRFTSDAYRQYEIERFSIEITWYL